MTLWIWLGLLLCSGAGDNLTVEAKPLKRNELPDGFPLQVQDVGFAVIQLRLLNQSSQAWTFDPESLRIFSPKKKRLKLASPEEITPKLMKIYSATGRGVHAAAQVGRQPTLSERERVPTVDPNRSPGTVSVDQGQRFRKLLEEFKIGEAVLQPGESKQGLLYVKSKKSGARLYGGILKLKDGTSVPLAGKAGKGGKAGRRGRLEDGILTDNRQLDPRLQAGGVRIEIPDSRDLIPS